MSLSAIVTYVPFARGCDSVGYLCDFSFFSSDTVYKCKADGEEFDRTEVVYSDHHITLIQIGWKPSLWKVKPWHTSTSTLRRVDFLFRVGPPSTRLRPETELFENALQTAGVENAGFSFSCGRKSFWKQAALFWFRKHHFKGVLSQKFCC